jgi:nucleotide-binding universal stress UspA family protein
MAEQTPGPSHPQTEILVGYDGSPDATTALDWAVAMAQRRSAPLCVVTTARYSGVPTPAFAGAPELTLDLLGLARDICEEGRLRAAKVLGDPAVRAVTDVGGPAGVLVESSNRSALVVVGHAGRGRLRPLLLGSVAFAVGTHAHCPVAVVPGEGPVLPGPSRPVVVGTDGSPGAEKAVRYAAAEAARWGASLGVVAVWTPPPVEPWRSGVGQATGREYASLLRGSARQASHTAADLARRDHPSLEVDTHLVEGDPADVVLDRAQGAGLLVVGTRGLGGLGRLLLGSVSRAVLRGAGGPTVVVRS